MSLRLEMLQVARVAPSVLGDSASLVETFLRGQQGGDGGFQNRRGQSDLYYTVFGIDGLTALQAELPAVAIESYLAGFGAGETLDFVHLCCLLRAWSALSGSPLPEATRGRILGQLEAFRTADGGYHQRPGSGRASAYGCLLGYGAYADHGLRPANAEGLLEAVEGLRSGDGGWGNEPGMAEGTTPAAAAAVTLYRHLEAPAPEGASDWILGRLHSEGGFLAFPRAPMPDLLSTGVALHALDGLEVGLDRLRDACLDFVDTLWSAAGGFHGNWADDEIDAEYTYYGLLALGHLGL
ncbi:MAG: prenyltransferase/squalene oxidase repeat-containing protein [Verrucomicrobiales bacterium]